MILKSVHHDIDKYTGVANIDVPIGTIECGALSLPISLNYNTGGNKVRDISSWVGFGWTLNTGGMITRRVAGNPDDVAVYGSAGIICNTRKGFLYTREDYSQSDFEDIIDYYLNNPPTEPMSDLIVLPAVGCIDTEPDEFVFQVNGYSGTMRFNWEDEYPIIISKYDFKIGDVKYKSSSNKEIIGWELIGPDGNHYYFEETETNVSGEATYPDYYSSWYLTKIVDPNEIFQIEIEYEDYFYEAENCSVSARNYCWNPNNNLCIDELHGTRFPLDDEEYGGEDSGPTSYLCKIPKRIYNSIDERELIFIPTSTNRTDITAIAGSSVPMLDKIEFYDSEGSLVNYTEFNYIDQGRPILDKIQKKGLSGESEPPHIFSYDKTDFPSYNSYSVDHWGYYNGKKNNTFIPKFIKENWVSVNGADRWSDIDYCKAAILEKITYPTGGYIQFDYELNDYYYSNLSAGYDSNEGDDEGGSDFENIIGEIDKTYQVCTNCSDTEPVVYDPYPDYLDLLYSENGWIMETEELTISSNTFSILASGGMQEEGEYICDPTGYIFLIKVGDPDFTIQWGFDKESESEEEYLTLLPGEYILGSLIQPLGDCNGELCPFSLCGSLTTYIRPNTGGGLRIKSKKINDGQTTKTIKYLYEKQIENEEGEVETISSGYLIGVPKYRFRQPRIYEHRFTYIENGMLYQGIQQYLWPMWTMAGNSKANTPLTNGRVIGYDKVIEEYGEEKEYGSKEYYFSNPLNPEYEISWVAPWGRPIFDDYTKGKLQKIITKDNTSSIVKEETYNYIFKTIDFYELKITEGPYGYGPIHIGFSPCAALSIDCECPQYDASFLEMFAVWEKTMPYGYAQLESKQTIIDGVTTTQNFIYDDKKQNVLSSSLTDGDNVKTTTYQYAEQLNETNLLDKHMVNIPLNILINDGAGGGSKIEYTQIGDMILPKKSSSASYENGSLSWKPQNEVFYFGTTDPFPDKLKRRNQIGDEHLTWESGNKTGLLKVRKYGETEKLYRK